MGTSRTQYKVQTVPPLHKSAVLAAVRGKLHAPSSCKATTHMCRRDGRHDAYAMRGFDPSSVFLQEQNMNRALYMFGQHMCCSVLQYVYLSESSRTCRHMHAFLVCPAVWPDSMAWHAAMPHGEADESVLLLFVTRKREPRRACVIHDDAATYLFCSSFSLENAIQLALLNIKHT
jgi:hypothetical protein